MGFHWLMAFVIFGLLISGLVMVNTDLALKLKFKIYQLHKSFGFLVLCLVCLRLIWRLQQPTPPVPGHLPDWQKLGAHASHRLLYLLMFMLPLSGWLVVSASKFKVDTIIFWLFKLPHLPVKEWVSDHKWLDAISKDIHFYLALILIATLLAHIGAALKHHIIEKDDVLTRMLPEKK